MKYYLNNDYVVVGGTLLTYSGNASELSIDTEYGDSKIQKIGKGAFYENKSIKRITLPSSVSEIGESAFAKMTFAEHIILPGSIKKIGKGAFETMPALTDITIENLEADSSQYEYIKSTSLRTYDGRFVAREFPKFALTESIVDASAMKPAVYIPENTERLFFADGIFNNLCLFEESKDRYNINDVLYSISFVDDKEYIAEAVGVMKKLTDGKKDYVDTDSEEANDIWIRKGAQMRPYRTAIFTFDDSKTVEKNNKYYLNVTLKMGCFFWQSLQKVIYESKEYYIYRRKYLAVDTYKKEFKSVKYLIRDIAVYDLDGPVLSKEVAMNVYGKYRLLSIL